MPDPGGFRLPLSMLAVLLRLAFPFIKRIFRE
jgi:hypothetical protein